MPLNRRVEEPFEPTMAPSKFKISLCYCLIFTCFFATITRVQVMLFSLTRDKGKPPLAGSFSGHRGDSFEACHGSFQSPQPTMACVGDG